MSKEIDWLTFRILVLQEKINGLDDEQIAKKLKCNISLVKKVFEEQEIEYKERNKVLKVHKDIKRKKKSVTLTSNLLEKIGITTDDFSVNEYVDVEINDIGENKTIIIKKRTKNSKNRF